MSNALLNRSTPTVPHRTGRTFLNRRTAVATVVAATLIGGGVAIAYPPGMGLEVAASATPNGGDPSQADVMVTLAHADPQCATTVTVGSTTTTFPAGTTTGTVTIPNGPGRYRVEARTVRPCSDNEHAHYRFVIMNAQASGPGMVGVKQNADINYSGLDPDASLTATATLSGGTAADTMVKSKGVGNDGTATIKFKFKKTGHWVVTTDVTPAGTTIDPVPVDVS